MTDVLDNEGEKFVQSIPSAQYRHLDVSQEEQWQSLMQWIEDAYGRLDILVNNAGVMGLSLSKDPQDPEHTSLETWKKIHAINADSVFLGCKYGISVMKKTGGSIINMSSRSGLVGVPDTCAYGASKAVSRQYSKSVALYGAKLTPPIRCNSIHPAAILTPIWDPILGNATKEGQPNTHPIDAGIPLGHMGEPADVAYAVLYLASEESKYITGNELVIDGGILAGSASAPAAPAKV